MEIVVAIAVVAAIVDGDTIELTDGTVVRFQAIDAPEARPWAAGDGTWGKAEPYGKQAKRFLKRQIPPGTRVMLAPVEGERDRDSHDRLLRTVYREDDGKDLSLALLKKGLAALGKWADGKPLTPAYLAAQQAAQEAGRGIWGPDGGEPHNASGGPR